MPIICRQKQNRITQQPLGRMTLQRLFYQCPQKSVEHCHNLLDGFYKVIRYDTYPFATCYLIQDNTVYGSSCRGIFSPLRVFLFLFYPDGV